MGKLHAKRLAIMAFSATIVSIMFNLLYVINTTGVAVKSRGNRDMSLKFISSKDLDKWINPVSQQGHRIEALEALPLRQVLDKRFLEIVNAYNQENPPSPNKAEVAARVADGNKTVKSKVKDESTSTGNKQDADFAPIPPKALPKAGKSAQREKKPEQDEVTLLKNHFIQERLKIVKSKTRKDKVQDKVTNDNEDYDNEIMNFDFLAKQDNSSYCPDKSPHLLGHLAGILNETTKEELVKIFPELEKGGRIRPSHCVPRQRLAIIMPYRNRYPHLHITLHNLIPILKRQQADATFFVIEQASTSTFNRGALMNIGFLEAEKLASFDCYIFHDVDLIPLNDWNLYRCDSNPRHYAVAMNKYDFKLIYEGYFGGVAGFSKEQYLKVNGNSNLYVGWGGEDDDLLSRIHNKNYKMLRYPIEIARYHMIKHTRDKGNKENPLRTIILRSSTKRQDIEGLNTVKYKVLNITLDSLYTWITVSINTSEILETAPEMTVKDLIDVRVKWKAQKLEEEKARNDALLKKKGATANTN